MKSEKTSRRSFDILVGGLKLYGIIHEPLDIRGKLPWVLCLHGFGGNKSGRSRYLVDLSCRLAEAGIATIRFDFRGAGDSEGQFKEQTVETLIEDAKAALTYGLLQPHFDPTRCALLGRSFGAYIASLLAPEVKNLKALALMVPFFGLAESGEVPFPHGYDGYTFHGMPISDQLVAQLRARSLTKTLPLVAKIPLLHIHGGKDIVVGPWHKEQFQQLRKGSDNLFIDLPNSDHELSDYAERMQSIEQVTEWLRQKL